MNAIPRNPAALPAKMRNSAGPMRHRLQPRGGARNDMLELLDEYEQDCDDTQELDDSLLNIR